MDLLLHPADDQGRGRPDRRGRLSTVGHRQAFRAFARAAKRAGIRFMLIGGTFRDVAVRAASTRDIDIVLIDQKDLTPELMAAAGFARVPRAPYVWRYDAEGRTVDLEIAGVDRAGRALLGGLPPCRHKGRRGHRGDDAAHRGLRHPEAPRRGRRSSPPRP